jgi:hypothetical protein
MKLSSIKPNPDNPRTIKDEAFQKLCRSITEFPKMMSLRPIVTDSDGVVLGGNMRLRALQHLGFKDVPDEWVRRADELTDDERRRFIVADNAGFGDWDLEGLAANWSREELDQWGAEIDWPKDSARIQEEQLIPFKTAHILISYNPDDHAELIRLISPIFEKPNFEIISGSN